jgi:hypothetical protein
MSENTHTQYDSFTIKGYWWVPETNHRVAGDLIYEEDHISLALYGGLSEARVESPFSATPICCDYPIIHGESLDGRPVTVLKTFHTKWKPDIRTLALTPGTCVGLRSSQLSCHEIIEGCHLSSCDEKFTKCDIEVPSFENWLGDSPFTVDMADSCEHVSIDYTRPKKQEFQIPARDCFVRFIRSVRPPGFPSHAPSIEHRATIEIASVKPMPMGWFQTLASEIVDLFSFFYGGNLLSRQVTLVTGNTDDRGSTLYYCRHKVKPVEFTAMDMVIRYESLKELFAQILEHWLTLPEAISRARRMVLSSTRRPSAFIEFRFLPLAHATEIIAETSPYRTFVDDATFTQLRTTMLEALPSGLSPELSTSIRSSLGWANGRNLKSKLLAMLNELQDETCHLFCIDKEAFVKGFVNTRNYYTHYSPKMKPLQGKELHWAIEKMSLMIRILLLLKAGVSEGILQGSIRSHIRLSQERACWGKIAEEGSSLGSTDND